MPQKLLVFIENKKFTLAVLAVGYLSILFYLSVLLKYDFMRSDVLSYWQDSLDWQTPFHPFHVPGYPLLLTLLRGISVGVLPPLYLMVVINITAFLGSGWLIMDNLITSGTSRVFASLSALLFGLWPFVGLTYTVTPLADLPAIFLFLLGLKYFQKASWFWSACFLGFSLLFHKALWPIVALFLISDFFSRKEFLSKRNIAIISIILLPLGILWLTGTAYHQSFGWMLESNLSVELASKSSLLIFDGIIGTLFSGGFKNIFKGIILVAFFIISAGSIFFALRIKGALKAWGLGIAVAITLLFIVLNQNEIWAAVRFSRLLVIPLAGVYPNLQTQLEDSKVFLIIIVSILTTLFLTQFIYSWYLARVFFP